MFEFFGTMFKKKKLIFHFRSKVPPRPAGQRTEPEPNTTFQGFGFGDGGFQMSLGIGAFPFGIFTSTFNFGTNLRSQSMYFINEIVFFCKAFSAHNSIWFTIFTNINLFSDPSTNVQFEEDQFLTRAFLWVTVIFLAWLVWA